MEKSQEMILTVVFNDRRVTGMILNQILQTPSVKVEIVRGRLNAQSAWFELRIQGDASEQKDRRRFPPCVDHGRNSARTQAGPGIRGQERLNG